MPKITVSESHQLEKDELETRVEEYMVKLRDHKLKAMNFDFSWKPGKTGLDISGKGFKGFSSLEGNTVTMTLDLSLMLSPFKGQVEEMLKKGLTRVLQK